MGKDESIVPTKHEKLTSTHFLVAKAGGHKQTNTNYKNKHQFKNISKMFGQLLYLPE